jgi:hypothetical protein
MSKWGLLFKKKGQQKQDSTASIHRHTGFEVIPKSKVFWPGYQILLRWPFGTASSKDIISEFCELYNTWCEHMRKVDCCAVRVVISFPVTTTLSMVQNIIDGHNDAACMRIHSFEVRSDSGLEADKSLLPLSQLELAVVSKKMTPFMSSCTFWCYQVPILGAGSTLHPHAPLKVFTREKGDGALSTRQLTSHVTYGVDNTGNVRVWQAESVMLYYLLKTQRAALRGRYVP